jgi:hypothetical protein
MPERDHLGTIFILGQTPENAKLLGLPKKLHLTNEDPGRILAVGPSQRAYQPPQVGVGVVSS